MPSSLQRRGHSIEPRGVTPSLSILGARFRVVYAAAFAAEVVFMPWLLIRARGGVEIGSAGSPMPGFRSQSLPCHTARVAGEYSLDFREHPEAYRYSPDERGVLKVEPYKSELLPLWRFKDEEAAVRSVSLLWERFEQYRAQGDFVGMDMVRKYLRMGFTRAMRYAKYPGGRKRRADGSEHEPLQWADPEKRQAAIRFREAWQRLRADPCYLAAKEHHVSRVFSPSQSPMGGRQSRRGR